MASRLAIHFRQLLVTDRAAGERAVGLQAQLRKHLADLALETLAGQEHRLKAGPLRQLPVSRKEHPALSAGQAHQLMIVHIWFVERIVSKDTQPLGQSANHSIGEKSHE